jgi:diguanylate cyclase (GGDEF)-like protein/PAS domain S-box-containing protein
MRPFPFPRARLVIGLATTVLATVFALSCFWEIKLEAWTMHALSLAYEPSFETAERWRFILTSTSFAGIALIVPAMWLSRLLRNEQESCTALRHEKALSESLARHDAMTGFFNRRVFNDRLAAILKADGKEIAVFLINLDRFKLINDSYGHAIGDKVLCEIAERLTRFPDRSTSSLARFGGDEFAMIVSDADKDSLASLAAGILREICTPLVSLEGAASISATIGISIAHVDAILPDALLHCADHAMCRGKSAGRATFRFYDPGYESEQQVAKQLEFELTCAVEQDQIEPFFQPFVNLPDEEVVGFEILARWPHPQRGMQMPSTFIPILDRLGMIPCMTFSLLRKSIEYAKLWPQDLMLAINVTASMLEDAGFADRLYDALVQHGFSPCRLEVEITEQALVTNIAAVSESLSKLRARGIGIALDDFGTGYSGIYHLTQLAIDKIKIDRSFLDLGVRGHDKVVSAVLGLANSFRIKAVAEGVEQQDTAHWLSSQRCDFAQGYLFGKPMSADQVSAYLRERRRGEGPARSRSAEQSHGFGEAKQGRHLFLEPSRNTITEFSGRDISVTGCGRAAKSGLSLEPEVHASRYRALIDLAYDAIVTMDDQHNITLFNRAAENLFGYSAAEVLGRPIVTLLPEKFRANHPHKVRQFADSYDPSARQATPPRMDESNSVYGRHRDGSVMPVEISVSKIDLNGRIEFMAAVRDISDRARLVELLKKEATTDTLTGLPNRRGFVQFLEKVLCTGDDLAVFVLDIDFFKKINDQHGHDAGDEVLRVLANVGASMTDGPSLFARWGGEEFVAALPRADEDLAHRIADDLRQRYERQDFEHMWRHQPIRFTVSIGVVTRKAGELDVDALMKRADRALYRAKKSGRNRVEVG